MAGRWKAVGLILVFTIAASAQRGRGGFRGGPGGGMGSDQYPTVAKTESEKRILAVLAEAGQAGETYLNVPAADGRLLRLLTEAANARSVVELGTSTGISGLWFSMALDRTGGKLTTFEIDPGRAATATAHFKKAGVDRIATVVVGDAHQNIKKLTEPIDVVFIDAEKEGYTAYLKQLLPLVRPGGLILAHNVDQVQDYLGEVARNPDLDTVIYSQGGGLAVTLKKR